MTEKYGVWCVVSGGVTGTRCRREQGKGLAIDGDRLEQNAAVRSNPQWGPT